MLAYNNVLINLDSYTGVFAQNYYIYKDHTNHYNPIIWDLNMAFGGFPYVGSGNTSMGSLTITNMQQLTPLAHSTDVYWPLIKNIIANPMYKKMYIAHMKTITNEIFANNNYQATATQLQTIIDTATLADSNKFFSYSQFQNGMTGNVVIGSYTVPGISTLMSARVTYLQGTTEFQQSAPVITSVTPNNSSPSINTTVIITASITNTNSNAVYLGYRNLNSEKFVRVLMYDDGNHNDGTANDNSYGAAFTITSSKAEYYIYAENNNAGMFSPERAEHEFYTLNANVQTATLGQVIINEFLAVNQNGQQNETGQYQDWIELYNTTNSPLDLFGLYLTDDYSNKTKFAFPQNSVIQPYSYVTIWADENATTTSAVHCNFKLSGTGEQLMLSNLSGSVLDSITFGPQSANISMARCPNGIGAFAISTTPTYNSSNCSVGINESNEIEFQIYPTPAYNFITIENKNQYKIQSIKIFNSIGELIIEKINVNDYKNTIDISVFNPGVYFVMINNQITKKIQIVK